MTTSKELTEAVPAHARQQLVQWAAGRTAAGITPEDVYDEMLRHGWSESVAAQAMEDALRETPALLARFRSALRGEESVAVPEPALERAPTRLRAFDRDVDVLMALKSPRVVLFKGLLDAAECDALVELARPRLTRSETIDDNTGQNEINPVRTSGGMFFKRDENELVARLDKRIGALLGWPTSHGEDLQVLHYAPGAEYKPHYDYFDPSRPGSLTALRYGGQRVGTLLMYLNTPTAGGGTVFPDIGLEVAPLKGNAVFFSYERAHPDTRTLHGGAPVIEGEKWVATKWLREGPFA